MKIPRKKLHKRSKDTLDDGMVILEHIADKNCKKCFGTKCFVLARSMGMNKIIQNKIICQCAIQEANRMTHKSKKETTK